MRKQYFLGLLLLSVFFCISDACSQSVIGDFEANRSEADQEPSIEDLIEGLADPRYTVRHRSQRLLEQRGLHAFDALLEAQEEVDPEVSVACKRLLTTVTEPWSLDGESIEVNAHLWDYGDSSRQERQNAIDEIGDLNGDLGVRALCRLVRFEPSDLNSQYAAIKLLLQQQYDGGDSFASAERLKKIDENVQALEDVYGPTKRLAFTWLRKAASESVGAEYWITQATRQPHFYDQDDWTSRDSLLWLALYRAHQQQDEKLLHRAFQLLTEENPESLTFFLQQLTERLADANAWSTIDTFLEKYQSSLNDRPGLYLQAHLASQRGDNQLAEQLAEEAFRRPALATPSNKDWFTQQSDYSWAGAQLLGDRVLMASTLDGWLHRDWALRELSEVSEPIEPMSISTLFARWKMAEMLYDSEQAEEASEVLGELLDYIQATNEHASHFRQLIENSEYVGVPRLDIMKGQYGLYHGMALRYQGDEQKAREALETGFQSDPGNADLIIAMYRSPEEDQAYQQKVRKRILQSCRSFEIRIASDPSNPSSYNHWAWIVANTEGDFEKAIRYSQRSLDLRPSAAGYLDTLGRCYFANGQIDEAIQVQQQAVDLLPSMQTMQRQLQEFLDARGQ